MVADVQPAEDARTALDRLARERGADFATLSRLIGRNPAYIQQYVRRGSPRLLAESDRRALAEFLDVDESRLGGPVAPPLSRFAVPWLSPRPSAGPGGSADGERRLDELGFPPDFLRALGTRPGRVSAVTVAGASMEPTLADGDLILVDHDAADRPLTDGIHVLRRDDELMVKRLVREVEGKVAVVSDNPAVPDQPGQRAASLSIVGRVVWFGRAIH